MEAGPSSPKPVKAKAKRTQQNNRSACEACRKARSRCSGPVSGVDGKCERCIKYERECVVVPHPGPGRARGAPRATSSSLPPSNRDWHLPTSASPPAAAPFVPSSSSAWPASHTLANASTSGNILRLPGSSEVPWQVAAAIGSTPTSHSLTSPNEPRPVPSSSSAMTNPLGLLADVSETSEPASGPRTMLPVETVLGQLFAQPDDWHLGGALLGGPDNATRIASLAAVLAPQNNPGEMDTASEYFRARVRPISRDVRDENDPLEAAMLTAEEATLFYDNFFSQLHFLLAILDPALHTPAYLRRTSKFLFTVVLLNGAQFHPAGALVSKRLRAHAARLARGVIDDECRSLEIIQAFLLWATWGEAPTHVGDDKSWLYINHALQLALELGVNHPVPSGTPTECVLAPGAPCLHATGMEHVDCRQRGERNHERLWLRLFMWESAHALATGRASMFPLEGELLKNERWHVHPLSLRELDEDTVAAIALRREVLILLNKVRYDYEDAATGVHRLRDLVESKFRGWKHRWIPYTAVQDASTSLLVYRGLQGNVSRLYILSHGLSGSKGHRTKESVAVVHDCLVTAIDACQAAVAVLEATRYWFMPNTVLPLIAFSAVLSLRLYNQDPAISRTAASAASLLGLLAILALKLEAVGANFPHRKGVSAIYGRRLRATVATHAAELCRSASQPSQADSSHPGLVEPATLSQTLHGDQPLFFGTDSMEDWVNVTGAFDAYAPISWAEEDFGRILADWAAMPAVFSD